MSVIPFVLPDTMVRTPADDDPQWQSFKWHMAMALNDAAVGPLTNEQAFAVVQILCQPHVETIERHMADTIVERGEVSDPAKLAALPAAVHRIVLRFMAEFVADFRAPRVVRFPEGRARNPFRNSETAPRP